MFKIGEFSRIARVSGRLLRYYDSIGLLVPSRIDPATGYRHYSADQLGRLNRILALKELGLSLDQIRQLLDGNITSDEIRGMFLLRKAELERSLSEEALRLRNVESRLKQIDERGMAQDDIVLKSEASKPFLAYRDIFPGFDKAVTALKELVTYGGRRIPDGVREALVVVAHSDFDDEKLDLEAGFALSGAWSKAIRLPSGAELVPAELPAAGELATLVRSGPPHEAHLAFGALGFWMEANNFEIDGPAREVFLRTPFEAADPDETVVEIQFPVRRPA